MALIKNKHIIAQKRLIKKQINIFVNDNQEAPNKIRTADEVYSPSWINESISQNNQEPNHKPIHQNTEP